MNTSQRRAFLYWGILLIFMIAILIGGVVIGLQLGDGQASLGDVGTPPALPVMGTEVASGGQDVTPTVSPTPGDAATDQTGEAPAGASDATETLTPTNTSTSPATSASTGRGSPVPTRTLRPTSTSLPTRTIAPTLTRTPSPTLPNTPPPVVRTATPTRTPTATPTSTATPTDTPTATTVPTTLPPVLPPLPDDPLERINYYRGLAGAPPIVFDDALNFGAQKHAEYMAAYRELTDSEQSGDPLGLYTPEGAEAAPRSNLWYGGGSEGWLPADPIDSWMSSPYHRLWVLYPRAEKMGFGFATNQETSATASVLWVFCSDCWNNSLPFNQPVRYPVNGQSGIPATRYGVSLQFPVYTPNPTFSSVTWVDQDGAAVEFTSLDPTNNQYMQQYGNAIFLRPKVPLTPWTTYTVHFRGSYNGQAFDLEWSFTTGE